MWFRLFHGRSEAFIREKTWILKVVLRGMSSTVSHRSAILLMKCTHLLSSFYIGSSIAQEMSRVLFYFELLLLCHHSPPQHPQSEFSTETHFPSPPEIHEISQR